VVQASMEEVYDVFRDAQIQALSVLPVVIR